MILALNIGNSNITFGSYTKDGKLVFSSRLFADTALSSDELLYKMVNMLALYGAEPREITDVIFSSVVPALTPRMREALHKMCEAPVMEVGPGLKSGVRIRMDNPASWAANCCVPWWAPCSGTRRRWWWRTLIPPSRCWRWTPRAPWWAARFCRGRSFRWQRW